MFTRAEQYAWPPIGIKGWITQVNSGHRDRSAQPTNVRMQVRK